MIRLLLSCILLMISGAMSAGAVIRVSHDDGAWRDMSWVPAGMPGADDTLIIATNVTGMPEGNYGRIIIRGHASLTVESGMPVVRGLVNEGRLEIARHGDLRVDGDILNSGTIQGEGGVRLTRNGGVISGTGTFGHLAISGGRGTRVHLANSITILSLAIGGENQLLTGEHDLTVNGIYASSSEFGVPGIIGAGGVIALNGEVEGSAQGRIVIGTAPGYRPSRRGRLPAVHGVLGDSTGSVRFMASREIGFSTLLGDVLIDSGVVLRCAGIGAQGWNRVQGRLTVRGTLAAGEELYRWIIEGDLFNEGRIENCTMVMQGHAVALRSGAGIWDPGINLTFLGDTGAELTVEGSITLSKLTIAPISPTDTNIALHAGRSVVKVRHSYTSDMARGCRMISDTVVKLWGAARGIVEGDVRFEGFWGSPVGGKYGGEGKTVRFMVRKQIASAFRASGRLLSDPNGHILVNAPAAMAGNASLRGGLTLNAGRVFTITCDTLRLAGSVHGGGTLHLTAPAVRLDASGTFLDSATLEVGRGEGTTSVMLARTLFGSRIVINPGSSIYYRAGDSMYASRELRYALRYPGGFSSASTACIPLDPVGTRFFSGAISLLRYTGAGYVAADSVKSGEGYFIRFPAERIVWHTGRVANLPMQIPIHAGWNLIGGASIPVHTSRITVSGTTLLSGFLNVLGGAVAVSVLEPGRGYWVNAAGKGVLVYNPEP